MIKAVIFDIDGVLVDSNRANIDMYQKLMKSAGYELPTEEAVLKTMHLPLWQGIKVLTKSNDASEITRIWEMVKQPGSYDVSLMEFPHNLEVTLEVLCRNYKMGIVTSRIRAGVADLFSQREIQHLFNVVVAADDVENTKPHPEPLQLALKKLKTKPFETVYVGDMDTDIEAAKAAGVKSIHLSARHHANASIGIGHFDEIIDAVSMLNKKATI